MDNQGSNFLSGNTFGVQQASVISNDTAELIFGGGSTASNPASVTPIKPKKKPTAREPIVPVEDEEDEDNETQNNRDPFPVKDKISADELLNDLIPTKAEDEEEDTPVQKSVPQQAPIELADESDNSEPGEDDTFGSITKELIKLGIFKERDEDSNEPIKSGEGLRDRFVRESEEAANEKIYNFLMSKHGQDGLDVFDALFVKGVPIEDYLNKYQQIQGFQNMDLTQEDNQKKIFREAYRRQGLSEDKIEKKLQRAIDYGDLEEETGDLHEILVKQEQDEHNYMIEQSAKEEETKRATRNQEANNYQSILGKKLKDREFDGIPVTDKVARETYDYLTTEKWQLPSGEKLTDFDKDVLELRDPKNHELKVKMALLLKARLDLTKIKTKAVTQESNRVFDTLVKRETQARRTQKTVPPSNSFLANL